MFYSFTSICDHLKYTIHTNLFKISSVVLKLDLAPSAGRYSLQIPKPTEFGQRHPPMDIQNDHHII